MRLNQIKDKEDRKIRDLTESELVELIQNLIGRGHFIKVSGIEVSTVSGSLKSVEKCIDRIITKHQDFLLLKGGVDFKSRFAG